MPAASEPAIAQLDEIFDRLDAKDRVAFRRVFHVSVAYGELVPPDTMRLWIARQFRDVPIQDVLRQKIVKVTNTVTWEGTLFNSLRSSRPISRQPFDLEEQLAKREDFDSPHKLTTEDTFGRVKGEWCVTASNVAKFDGFHGLVIFDDKNPLFFTRAEVHDYLNVAEEWARRAQQADPSAKYYFLIWNCLHRAGASLLHGHAQVLLGRDMHYAEVEGLRQAALRFGEPDIGNYFDALYTAHELVGAGFRRDGVRVLAHLVPVKEHEVILMADEMSDALKDRIYDVLACFRDRLGVQAFNLAICCPPLAPTEENWEGFPTMVRIVDRGDPASRTSDIGGMELYAASVVASDPLKLAQTLQEALPA